MTYGKILVLVVLVVTVVLAAVGPEPPRKSEASPVLASAAGYPRLANVGSDTSNPALMARWDLYVLRGETYPDWSSIYAANLNLVILAYADAIYVDYGYGGGIGPGTPPTDWYIRDSHGNPLSISGAPGAPYGTEYIKDVTQYCPQVVLSGTSYTWNEWISAWASYTFFRAGRGNGQYWDDTYKGISAYFSDIDLDRNGQNDLQEVGKGAPWVDAKWDAGLQQLFSWTRYFVGSGAVIIGNGNADQYARVYNNGRQNQGWTPDWATSFTDYMTWEASHAGTEYFIVDPANNNGLVDSATAATNYKAMRFYLTTTLMGSGYFMWVPNEFDTHDWYDEYSVNLATGHATGDASAKGYLGAPLGAYTTLANGVGRRDFANGIALVNPTSVTRWVVLEKPYRHILGTQDATVNNGATTSLVAIPASDGIILLD